VEDTGVELNYDNSQVGQFKLSASHCVHIIVEQAPEAMRVGCTDTTAANYDDTANTQCEVNDIPNGCCEYIIQNQPPVWVFPDTWADGTHFDVCDYDDFDPRTGEAWAIEHEWYRWNTVDGISFDLVVEDYNNGDAIDINFDCDLAYDGFTDCPVYSFEAGDSALQNYVEDSGGDNEILYVIASKVVHWDVDQSLVDQCHNGLVDSTGSHQQDLSSFTTYGQDNSHLNDGTEPPENDVVITDTLTYTAMVRVPPTVWFDGQYSHDDTISVEIGCSVDFTVLAHDCNSEDTVSLYVLEDPGLPNGATVDALSHPNGDSFNAERNFHWTPSEGQGGKTYRVCFISRDNSDICELNGWYSRDEVCLNIAVGNVGGLSWSSTASTHSTPVGCTSEADISVYENNGYCINDIEFHSAAVQASEFLSSEFVDTAGSLPASISLSSECHEPVDDGCHGCDLSGRTSCTKTITHTPTRGDEGSCTEVCFTAADAYGINTASVECATFCVPRCKYCVSEGDTLHDVANVYTMSTDWLRLWNSNPHVTDPDTIFHENDVLDIGPVYHVQQGDTVRALSHRFSTTDQTIMALNPDITESEDLTPGQPLCVTPCSVKGSSSSNTYSWGY